MQFLPLLALSSVLLFSVAWASPLQLPNAEINSIVDSVVDEMAKKEALLAKTETTEPIVVGLNRRKNIICQVINGRLVCHVVWEKAQLKFPKTGDLLPVKVSFDLKATLDGQQPHKMKDMTVEDMDIKVRDEDQKPEGPHFVGGFGKKFRKHLKSALKTATKNLSIVAQEVLNRKATEIIG